MPDNCEICIALKKKRKKKRKKNHASCEKEECEKKKNRIAFVKFRAPSLPYQGS